MKRTPLVYFLFLCSGVTALIYEIVWTRMLTLVFGHTVFSVSVVLSAFMAGLGFGCYFFGFTIDRLSTTGTAEGENSQGFSPAGTAPLPLLVYGWIEIMIAVTCALLSLLLANFADFYSWMHQWLPDSAALQNAIKALFSFTLIFIPTTLMGATLPIISKYYVTDNTKLGTQVGFLYALNTLGAALGCLLAGFLFISALGVLQTVLYATLVNLFIGVSAIRIYQDSGGGAKIGFRLPKIVVPSFRFTAEQKFWMGVSFVCGFTALAYEVLWTRLLVFSIASTVYSFSMMLAVFLLGIFLGSLVVVPVISRVSNLRTVLLILQGGIGLYVIGSLYSMELLLSPPWNSYNLEDPAVTFFRYFKDSSSLMLIPTMFFGMSLPILIKMASGNHENIGWGTGQVYSSNTFGGIFGSLLAGFLILPKLGTQASLTLIAACNLLLAVFIFWKGSYLTPRVRRGLTAIMVLVVLFINTAIPKNLLESFFMRDSAGGRSQKSLLFFEEGLTDTVAVFKDNYGILDPTAKRLITNGISMSASNVIATRYMKLFAHVPILLSDRPDNVLVVCFGTGQTTGAAGIHPRVKSVDSLELSASVIRAGKQFSEQNHDVLNNPKVNIILQDGRNHLLTTKKMYDVITSEPPPPRTAFTVNLYTREYYEITKTRLNPGGIVAQWIPLHSQSADEVAMHFRTFLSVFPHAMAWLSVANEILIIGSDQPLDLDFEKMKQRMEEPVLRDALKEIEIHDIYSFLSNIWLLEPQMEKLAAGFPVITDNRPKIEFYLDLGGVIKISGRERFVFNRTPFEDIVKRISNMNREDQKKLYLQYRVMSLYQRGVMYSNRGQLLEAISMVEENELFRYHLQGGHEQVDQLVRQIKEDPKDREAMLNLGHIYYQVGEYEKSIQILEKILKRDPGQGYANLYMGYNLMEQGKNFEAKKFFHAAAKNDPAQLKAVMQESALIDLLSQLNKNPGNLGLLTSAAQFYNMKSEYLKALQFSLKAQAIDPLNIKVLQSIVFSYRGLGEPNEALIYATRYEMVDKKNIHLQYIIGELFAKTLRCEKAAPYLKKVLSRNDTYQNAQELLDNCRSQPTT